MINAIATRLKPCPFCGGSAKELDRFNSNIITCRRCGVKVKQSSMGEGDAAERWNKRAAQMNEQDAKEVQRSKRDTELLDAIQASCWDVRFISHSNGDDYSIGIEIIGHYMEAPHERVMGENYNENLRAALEQATLADAYPPARPEYPDLDDAIAQQGKGEA